MPKSLLIIILFISNIGFAQTFNNYNFNTQNSDQLVNILEYETGYLLTGYISDSAYTAADDFFGSPVLLKLSKSGNPLDTIYPTTFGYTELAQTTIYKDGYFYIFGTTNPQNDSIQLVVTKYDTSFNYIHRKVYSKLKGFYYLGIHKTSFCTDSTMYFFGYHYDYQLNITHSYILKYNFNTMEIDKFGYIPKDIVIYDLLVNNEEDKYTLTCNSISFQSQVLTYDSSFVLLTNDTLFMPGITNATLQSVININEYRDSLYLCLGAGDLVYPINNPTHFIDAIVLQTLDSNFQIKDLNFWFHDSLTGISLSNENAMIKNDNIDYFLGATVYLNIFEPDKGLLIVKIDSNLNIIWKKHIECTAATMRLMNMLPTYDGGVLVLYWEQASLTGAQLMNSKLIKIGPNGEVTTIYEFKSP
ncbi:MAG: hypothetical protein DRI84_07485, partial [Bacteroidetes bacterium]